MPYKDPEKRRASALEGQLRYQGKRKLEDPEGWARSRRNSWLKCTYGYTLEQYEAVRDSQGSCCAICKTPAERPWSLHMDHDHSCCSQNKTCGECFRALLCQGCNQGLGFFKENAEVLQAAMDYLETHRARRGTQ